MFVPYSFRTLREMFVKSGVGGESMLAQERKMFQKASTKDQDSPKVRFV